MAGTAVGGGSAVAIGVLGEGSDRVDGRMRGYPRMILMLRKGPRLKVVRWLVEKVRKQCR
ncbi:MAG: hypothetical protein OHK005_03400 [Candidatus Methylacidiphilales bacterium]